jgi:putative DNA primase/helicase
MQHHEHLALFRIPDELLAAAEVRSVSDFELRQLFGTNGQRAADDLSGILFPYLDASGHRVGARVRLDRPTSDGGKYYSEPGNKHLFFPPGAAAYFNDTSVPVVIVESEKAALAITALTQRSGSKFLSCAVGGCWGWKRKRGKKPKPDGSTEPETGPSVDLDLIAWNSRLVLIAYDSNAFKDDVRRARAAFAKELIHRSAKVTFCEIPAAPNINGPDDLIRERGDAAMLDVLAAAENPVIEIRAGEGPAIVDAAERILLQHAERLRIFQRAGAIVRVIELAVAIKEVKLKVVEGTILLDPLSAPAITEAFDRVAQFQKFRAEKDGSFTPYRVDCPTKCATTYLSRRGHWKLPNLTGVIATPVMRLDGSILSRPGFDHETGLFFASKEPWPDIPARPTQDDATAALKALLDPFAEFPFEKHEVNLHEEHEFRAAHAATILTGIERRLLPSAPLCGYSSPAQRSGKTLLAECVSIIATGKPAPGCAVSKDKEEFRKVIASMMLAGYAIVNLDNIDFVFGSPFFAQALTSVEYSDRNLGETKNLQLPTNLLWTAAGCNLTFKSDLSSRAILCKIYPQTERPEARTFKRPQLKDYIIKQRPILVAAALTILRGYFTNGCPNQNLPNFGGFELWSDIIRSALVWAGAADCCGTRSHVAAEDPEVDAAAKLLGLLHATFDKRNFTLEATLKAATVESELHNALMEVAASNKEGIDVRKLGLWVRRWKDRIIQGLRLRRANTGTPALWKVDRLEG